MFSTTMFSTTTLTTAVRRTFTARFSLVAALLFTALFVAPNTAVAQSGQITTKHFGGGGGWEFPLTAVNKIELGGGGYHRDYLCTHIKINGVSHGGGYSERPGSLLLGNGEYINYMEIAGGKYVDYVKVRTNKGRELAAGNKHANKTILRNIRVLRIGGRKGETLDRLSVEFIANYRESKVVDQNALFVLQVVHGPSAPGAPHATHLNRTAASKVTQLMSSARLNAVQQAEYFATVSAAYGLQPKSTNVAGVAAALRAGTPKAKQSLKIPAGHIAVLVNAGKVLESNGTRWAMPQSMANWVVINPRRVSDCQQLAGAYDLGGVVLTRQVPNLKVTTKGGLRMIQK